MNSNPDFLIELQTAAKIVAGVDEAGRGPLCGPVVAAAVIFPNKFFGDEKIQAFLKEIKINDSKKLSKTARAKAYDWIIQNTIWATGFASPEEIDDINILNASMLAMTRAVDALVKKPDICLIDGNKVPKGLKAIAVVRGDTKSLSIAAASIIAKETRDNIMKELDKEFPEYGYITNSGYPTKAHLQAIKKYGINKYYRKTFKPIKEMV